jgi:hypothetical protein
LISIDDKLYIASGSRLWIYDGVMDSWTDEPIHLNSYSPLSMQEMNGHILFISHGSNEAKAYEPLTKSWSSRSHYKSYSPRSRTFVLIGKVYIVHEVTLIKYDPAFEN